VPSITNRFSNPDHSPQFTFTSKVAYFGDSRVALGHLFVKVPRPGVGKAEGFLQSSEGTHSVIIKLPPVTSQKVEAISLSSLPMDSNELAVLLAYLHSIPFNAERQAGKL